MTRPGSRLPSPVRLDLRFERWLGAVVPLRADDLARKHALMAADPLRFLRGSLHVFLDRFRRLTPRLAEQPPVVGCGDAHVENFGTWRDTAGRLVWGVNDVDELGWVPWPLDLVRLATSVLTAGDRVRLPAGEACAALLDGWRAGIEAGGPPHVLDGSAHRHLRRMLPRPVPAHRFWRALDRLEPVAAADVPRLARVAVAGAGPWRPAEAAAPGLLRWHRRVAGTGSLGRARLVAAAQVDGSPVAREVKQLGPVTALWPVLRLSWGEDASGVWPLLERGPLPAPAGRSRCFGWQTRALGPDARVVELTDLPERRDERVLLHAMGGALAVVHVSDPTTAAAASAAERSMPAGWLHHAATRHAGQVLADHAGYAARRRA